MKPPIHSAARVLGVACVTLVCFAAAAANKRPPTPAASRSQGLQREGLIPELLSLGEEQRVPAAVYSRYPSRQIARSLVARRGRHAAPRSGQERPPMGRLHSDIHYHFKIDSLATFGDMVRLGFLNKHQTGTSNGSKSASGQADLDDHYLGVTLQKTYSAKRDDPVHFVRSKSAELEVDLPIRSRYFPSEYGCIIAVGKDRLKRRTLWCHGDSTTDAGGHTFDEAPRAGLTGYNYFEALIFGAFDLRDVKEWLVEASTPPWKVEALKATGLPIHAYKVPSYDAVSRGQRLERTATLYRGDPALIARLDRLGEADDRGYAKVAGSILKKIDTTLGRLAPYLERPEDTIPRLPSRDSSMVLDILRLGGPAAQRAIVSQLPSRPSWRNDDAVIQTLIERGDAIHKLTATLFSTSAALQGRQFDRRVDALLARDPSVASTLATTVLTRPEMDGTASGLALLRRLVEHREAHTALLKEVLPRKAWKNVPQAAEIVLQLTRASSANAISTALFLLTKNHWAQHPRSVEILTDTVALVPSNRGYLIDNVLENRNWQHKPLVRQLCGEAAPSYSLLRAAVDRTRGTPR